MNGLLNVPHNCWIATLYKDGSDCISPHHDKMADLDPQGWVVVWRLGAPRLWELFTDDEMAVQFEVFAGDAIFMNSRGNAMVKHGVPELEHAELSGSIVGRTSRALLSWAEVQRRAGAPQ